jgi:hypothetical protein
MCIGGDRLTHCVDRYGRLLIPNRFVVNLKQPFVLVEFN